MGKEYHIQHLPTLHKRKIFQLQRFDDQTDCAAVRARSGLHCSQCTKCQM